jgi:hypothetical protein
LTFSVINLMKKIQTALLKKDFYCKWYLKNTKKRLLHLRALLPNFYSILKVIKNDGGVRSNKVRLVCQRNNFVMKQGDDYGLLPSRRIIIPRQMSLKETVRCKFYAWPCYVFSIKHPYIYYTYCGVRTE